MSDVREMRGLFEKAELYVTRIHTETHTAGLWPCFSGLSGLVDSPITRLNNPILCLWPIAIPFFPSRLRRG
jgi:hypothetical protein